MYDEYDEDDEYDDYEYELDYDEDCDPREDPECELEEMNWYDVEDYDDLDDLDDMDGMVSDFLNISEKVNMPLVAAGFVGLAGVVQFLIV